MSYCQLYSPNNCLSENYWVKMSMNIYFYNSGIDGNALFNIVLNQAY